LPWDKLQLELGYDLLLPSQDPVVFLLNAKLGTPENTFFKGSPSLAAGIFGVGIKGTTAAAPGTDFDVVYGQVQKNLPWGGFVSAGGYYGAGAGTLWKGGDGVEHRAGFIGAVAGPDINVNLPGLKKLIVVADVQTGKNLYGAAGGGVSFYFNDNIAALTGPVYFLDRASQPGSANWMWTVQPPAPTTTSPLPAGPASEAAAVPPAAPEPVAPSPTPATIPGT
jgi:hypothetical protein